MLSFAESTKSRRGSSPRSWPIALEDPPRRRPGVQATKAMVKGIPPLLLRPVLDAMGFITESLQLPLPFMGLEARPYGSILVSNVGTYGLDSAFAPVPPFVHVPFTIVIGAISDKVLAEDGQAVIRPVLPLSVCLDHRFVDGYQAATMAESFANTSPTPPPRIQSRSRPRRATARPRRQLSDSCDCSALLSTRRTALPAKCDRLSVGRMAKVPFCRITAFHTVTSNVAPGGAADLKERGVAKHRKPKKQAPPSAKSSWLSRGSNLSARDWQNTLSVVGHPRSFWLVPPRSRCRPLSCSVTRPTPPPTAPRSN